MWPRFLPFFPRSYFGNIWVVNGNSKGHELKENLVKGPLKHDRVASVVILFRYRHFHIKVTRDVAAKYFSSNLCDDENILTVDNVPDTDHFSHNFTPIKQIISHFLEFFPRDLHTKIQASDSRAAWTDITLFRWHSTLAIRKINGLNVKCNAASKEQYCPLFKWCSLLNRFIGHKMDGLHLLCPQWFEL